jgi:hypothetical protein
LANPDPVAISPPSASNPEGVGLFDPRLKLPYTLQWNVAIEQGLGRQQSLSASYVGATGRRLLETAFLFSPNASLSGATLVTNPGTSDYDALQVQFQRRLSHGLQVLSSYTWSHSIDTGSAGSTGIISNALVPSIIAGSNRGPSDFDIRHTFSAGVTYNVPARKLNALTNAFLGGWSVENIVQVRSAPPVEVSDSLRFFEFQGGFSGDIRPDLVLGKPLYIYGAECASTFQATGGLAAGQFCPGGRGLNPAAFTDPPTIPTGCNPLVDFPCNLARQGNLGRNALRGFGAAQWDFAVHREFPIRESMKLQFRAEMFNVLNHPDFATPDGVLNSPVFGLSQQMLGRSLGGFGSSGSGAFSSLYQMGGPRSIQLALKLAF